jgi:predicted DNA-binding transcriptional regulator YafY
MPRSTKADKARQLNVAHRLLKRNVALPDAAQRLARQFGLSLRQAYRYLEEAVELVEPVEIAEATVPVTLKLPPTMMRAVRAYARSSGLTIGVIVTRALGAFLRTLRRHG